MLYMEYKDVVDALLTEFPTLRERYEEEQDYSQGLPHLVYEIVFVPYLKEGKDDTELISKAAEFMERLLTHEDERIQEVVVVSVLEPLLPERELLMKLKKHLGPKAQESLALLERYYGWS